MNHSQTLVKKKGKEKKREEKEREETRFLEKEEERATRGMEKWTRRVSNWLDDGPSPSTGLLKLAFRSGDDDSRIYSWMCISWEYVQCKSFQFGCFYKLIGLRKESNSISEIFLGILSKDKS